MLSQAFPILEFDPTIQSVIEPSAYYTSDSIPERVVVTFFKEIIDKLIAQNELTEIRSLKSEMGRHPIYAYRVYNQVIAVFLSGVGAPLATWLVDELIALGGKKFVACGGAGALDADAVLGQFIIPVSAVRDEGTSYHYLAPSREVSASNRAIGAIENVLKNRGIKYILSKTWTTDAVFRETVDKIQLRKEEGCLTVEMEAASFFAVAEFRRVDFGQILYTGDHVGTGNWEHLNPMEKLRLRQLLFTVACETCLAL